jgi:hypothetical protein
MTRGCGLIWILEAELDLNHTARPVLEAGFFVARDQCELAARPEGERRGVSPPVDPAQTGGLTHQLGGYGGTRGFHATPQVV